MGVEGFYNRHAETMSRDELERLKLERLKWTVRHAYENVRFYREAMRERGITPDDIKTLDDLRKLPFTDKETLRATYPFGLLAVPKSELVEIHMTSGTTGTPTVGLYTMNDIEVWAEVMARSLYMSGLRKEDVFQITPSFGLFTGGFGFYYGARKIGAFIVPTGAGNSRRQIQLMRDLGTTMICAVVSYVLRLTETAYEMGVDPARDTKVRKGVFGSEMWTVEMRQRIARAWDMDVYDIYGFTELCGPGVANDCYLHDGLHLWEDHFLVEVIDPKTGEPVGPEERGELVFTTLTKEAMPLIRYRSRDISRIYDARTCDCGRTHLRIERITGRIDDMVKVRGVAIWPSAVESILMKFPELGIEYQITLTREKGLDVMKLTVELASPDVPEAKRKELAERIRREIAENLMVDPVVELVNPMTLPRQEVGKAKRVIDMRT